MYLGDYYDAVMSEAGLSKEAQAETDNEVEQVKVAEAIEVLKEAGAQFDSEEEATAAVMQHVEDDYAEKVAHVVNEFEIDKVSFDSDEEKVAAAMEIVDGWEKSVVEQAKAQA